MTRLFTRVVIGFIALLALGACAAGASRTPVQTSLALPDSTSSVQGGDLRIAALDVLEIKVFEVASLSGTFQVDPQGQVKMPLIGAVDARGQTTFQLARTIEEQLKQRYLQNPQVTVRVAQAFDQLVTVEGAVTKPGIYPVRGGVSLLQVIALSGGFAEGANQRRVVIFRTIDGKRQAAGFDMKKIRTGEAEDPAVFGNDIVVVDGGAAARGYREFIRAIPVLGIFTGIY